MKYALVTGGSRGIGRAVAIQLAADGYAVIINYKGNDAAANETLQTIQQAGGTAELLKFDISDAQAVKTAIEAWQAAHAGEYIAVLVNNAGIRKDNLLVFMEENEWQSVLNTNLNSFYAITHQLIQPMIRKRFGRVVNMVSLSGLKGLPGQVNYSAAKAGMIGATKALAQEVASRNITVNAVAPGFVQTEMLDGLPVDELKKMIPMRRFGTVEEIAHLVSFLVSEKSSYITGEVININGGLYS